MCMTWSHTLFDCILKNNAELPHGRECEKDPNFQVSDGRDKVKCKFLASDDAEPWNELAKDGKCNDYTQCCCPRGLQDENNCGTQDVICRKVQDATDEIIEVSNGYYRRASEGTTKDNKEGSCSEVGRAGLPYLDYCAFDAAGSVSSRRDEFVKTTGCCIKGGKPVTSLLELEPGPGMTAGSLGKFKQKKKASSKKSSGGSRYRTSQWRYWECEAWEQVPACPDGEVPYVRLSLDDTGVCLGNNRGDRKINAMCSHAGMTDYQNRDYPGSIENGCRCLPNQLCGAMSRLTAMFLSP